jgi:hypothetical protein
MVAAVVMALTLTVPVATGAAAAGATTQACVACWPTPR